MARTEARLKTGIWEDPDFLVLPGHQQLVYLFLLSQPDISHCGVLPLRLRRWAKKLKCTPEQLNNALAGLDAARFIVVDDDFEELLVRLSLRNNEVYKQPNVLVSASRQIAEVISPKLRAEILIELQWVEAECVAEIPEGSKGPIQGMIADLQQGVQ